MRAALRGALLALAAAPAAGQLPDVPVFGLGGFEHDAPISIEAEHLDAREEGAGRRLVFRRSVRVRQGELRLRSQRLEAFYPAGSSEPSRLSAGRVQIQEGSRRARCDEVSYDRPSRTLVCRGGPAELWDGRDHLTGREIRFDLADHRVTVEGEPRLELHSDWLAGAEDAGALESAGAAGPVAVSAQRLEARDADEEREIHFSEQVVVRRGDMELRADELRVHFAGEGRQPERMLARGDVRVHQGDREARCAEADYRPGRRTLACRGGARLRQGDQRLDSERIVLDWGSARVDASGGATLRIVPPERS